jgi:hypothetical protein
MARLGPLSRLLCLGGACRRAGRTTVGIAAATTRANDQERDQCDSHSAPCGIVSVLFVLCQCMTMGAASVSFGVTIEAPDDPA